MLTAKSGNLGDTGFEGMNASQRAAEVWHCVAGLKFLKETLLVKV